MNSKRPVDKRMSVNIKNQHVKKDHSESKARDAAQKLNNFSTLNMERSVSNLVTNFVFNNI